ncbi:hypothetical protein [Peribacillus sp. R9-11]|uniref:hypothetical protein n=1 Tax=Peribacillus sp. R9-11 TaxID=3073271 RepID=UPI002868E3A1|nr:hypothetical protein [Peribacillus sp. R9-11]WMX58984.1 hypothetical protein RE409_30325 [Peribacillus sp. R9-11]
MKEKLFNRVLERMEKRSQNAGKYQKVWLYVLYGYLALCLFFFILHKVAIFLVFMPLGVILYLLYVQGNKSYKKRTEKILKKYKN